MAAYNVYGVGNALVDIEYTVTPDQLQDLGIEKGVMTLVDAEQQNQVIACLGEQLKHRGSGGSAANTIIALCQLGEKPSTHAVLAMMKWGGSIWKIWPERELRQVLTHRHCPKELRALAWSW